MCLEALCTVTGFTVNITSLSSFVGMIFYINGMVTDLKARLKQIDDVKNTATSVRLAIYMQQIDFHNEVIRYFQFL